MGTWAQPKKKRKKSHRKKVNCPEMQGNTFGQRGKKLAGMFGSRAEEKKRDWKIRDLPDARLAETKTHQKVMKKRKGSGSKKVTPGKKPSSS